MRPRRFAHKALDEMRRRDRPRIPCASIFHIGELAVDHLVVILVERHPPDALARHLPHSVQPLGQRIVIREQPGMFIAERHEDSPRQRRQIHHERRLVVLVDVPDHVTKHQTPLGIRIDDLDCLPRERRYNISRTLCIAVRHILDKPDGPDHIDLRLPRRKRVHQPDHTGRARHIALHVFHAAGWLDRNPARIEANALPDKRERCPLRPLLVWRAVPFHDDNAAFLPRSLPDPEQSAHPDLRQLLLVQHRNLDTQRLQHLGPLCKLHRIEHIWRLVHKIARHNHTARKRLRNLRQFPRRRHIAQRDID